MTFPDLDMANNKWHFIAKFFFIGLDIMHFRVAPFKLLDFLHFLIIGTTGIHNNQTFSTEKADLFSQTERTLTSTFFLE